MADFIEWIQKLFKLLHVMIFRDIKATFLLITFQIKLMWYKRQNKVLLNFFDDTVRRFKDKTAIIYHGQHYTFQEVANLSNKIANWLESTVQIGRDEQYEQFHKVSVDNGNGVEQMDNTESKIHKQLDDHLHSTQVGLLLGNIPELPSFIIGLSRVRCSAVLFNTNHRRDTLVNAFRATNCQAFIFESKYLSAIQDIATQLPDIRFFMYDRNTAKNNVEQFDFNYQGLSRLDLQTGAALDQAAQFSAMLNLYPTTPVLKSYPYSLHDMINYVFTSGTTGGNIKAAPVDNIRNIASYYSQCRAFNINSKDNVYICLPCYHSFAGVTGLGYMFIGGATLTLADKFSASKFWQDCCQNNCTVALYIGEVCRYLLAQPQRPEENKHSLRIMIGPGLKKEIWHEFQTRFNIKQIGEYYGSTEGNIQIFNIKNVEGSCGFIPYYYGIITKFLFHIYLIKVNPDTMELERGRDGLCIFAKPGDTGMLVGEIRTGMSFAEFLGYTSKQESSKKIVRNVRRKGDFAFVSGDLMVMDFYGNLYFKDRTGDTFRWKGENVSTFEIETIVAQFLNHKDCAVYGVLVPNCDGRAGMMACSDQQINMNEFYSFMKARVPDYAIPKFVRITDEIQTTSTMKYIKYPLREASFHLDRMKPGDRLYYFDRTQMKYKLMDRDEYEKIMFGKIQIS